MQIAHSIKDSVYHPLETFSVAFCIRQLALGCLGSRLTGGCNTGQLDKGFFFVLYFYPLLVSPVRSFLGVGPHHFRMITPSCHPNIVSLTRVPSKFSTRFS